MKLSKVKNKTLPQSSYVPIYFGEVAAKFRKEIGLWLLANVDQEIGWTQKQVLVVYRDRKILLLPATKKYYAAAAIISDIPTLEEDKTFLMQFLSALTWYQPGKLDIVRWTDSTAKNNLTNFIRMPLTKRSGTTMIFFRPTELPDPKNPEAQLALALFREGLSLNHKGYSFLSYFKIINLRYRSDDKQKRFIKRSLPLIENQNHLKETIRKLKAQHPDLVSYIYGACRCAVAHASMKFTTYDPESTEDERRFYQVLPIVHALAKLIIENEFNIKSKHTIHSEHLYELDGFHNLLGSQMSQKLKEGESPDKSEIKFDKKISLRLWGKPKLKTFENLTVEVISTKDGVLTLLLTRDNTIQLQITLDFPKEKLIFDPTQPISFQDDGSKNAALQMSYAYRFYSEFMGNPVLEPTFRTNVEDFYNYCN